MCGIAGFIPRAGTRPERIIVEGMCDRLQHRGPDSSGYFCDELVALGHRRLSIVDLSGGGQPLGNEDGSVQVVFNGEIYNYLELRQNLAASGHVFRTASDTEVLVHLYEEVGERLPEYLNGMFAFAVWDTGRRKLLVARDRLGKKPVYYINQSGGLRFAFASELKALLALPGIHPAINARAIADFLSLSYIPDPDSIYEGIYKLPAAHALSVSESGVRVWQYWQPRFAAEGDLDFDQTVEQVRSLARDAVKRRMIGDVPLGVFLSGGVDSSAVTGLMAEQASSRIKSFSIGFTDPQFDERSYVGQAVEQHHTEHYESVISPRVEDVLEQLPEMFDEPFGDSSAVPMTYLARMTRRHVTVALSGDGADEVFGGYRRYRWGVIEQQWRERFPGWFRKSVIKAGARWYPKLDFAPQSLRAKTLLTNLSQEVGDAYYTSMTALRDRQLDRILSPDLRRELGGDCARERFRSRFRKVAHLNPLQQMQAVDFETYLPGDILVKTDRVTMASSLEARSPWLDYRIVELAGRMPMHFNLRGNSGKYLFKQAVAPYTPSEVLTRPKMGFSVPLDSWFRTSLRPIFESLLFQAELEPYFSAAGVRQLWREHQSGRHSHGRKLWNLLMFALWHARYARNRKPFAGALREEAAKWASTSA